MNLVFAVYASTPIPEARVSLTQFSNHYPATQQVAVSKIRHSAFVIRHSPSTIQPSPFLLWITDLVKIIPSLCFGTIIEI
jgi:hypothetical protein